MNTNTGLTIDPKLQHYVTNPEGVLSNNRHYIAETQMEYQPNGDATTEGQSLQVLGYCYSYLATGDVKYLEKAKWYWDAYVDHYYAGDPIPDTPRRWIANWIINGKEPVLANYPINAGNPTEGGYKCVPLRFTNGRAQIPHGSPYWGEYLDVLTYAHRGHMTWDSINGSVQALTMPVDWEKVLENRRTTMAPDPSDSLSWVNWDAVVGEGNYSVDWNNKLPEHKVTWINVWTGNRIGIGKGPNDQLWNGEIIETDIPQSQWGELQLEDDTINGVYFVNYAVRLPVDKGGYLFKRNEVWHNRPIHTPLLGSANQRGNAADGEEWFMDACYMLWVITKEEKYKKAMDACHFTTMEYTDIDSSDMFFRKDTSASTPFTDGISYGFVFPASAKVTYGRDPQGYIKISSEEAVQASMEQQAVWFRFNRESKIRTTYGGTGRDGSPVGAGVRMVINLDKAADEGTVWVAPLPPSTSDEVISRDVYIGQLVQSIKEDGTEYILADLGAISHAGDIKSKAVYYPSLLDGRSGLVVESFFPDNSGYYNIGNWLQEGGKAPITSITYKADADFNLRLTDDDLWNWCWMLPNTNGEWKTVDIPKGGATLSAWQPNKNGRPKPSAPVYNKVGQFDILLDNSSTVNATFSYYCLNEIPPTYPLDDGYSMNYRLTLTTTCPEGFTGRIGNCHVVDYRDDSLAYTPGLIPFSNIYAEGSDQFGAWHGMPYPGYQYPFIYSLEADRYSRELTNMTDFLYDAQAFYAQKFGVVGPVASAFIWNRWDNFKYGPPDTFTMYHWGDGNAWSGYQPRAFQGAARAWQELTYQGKQTPEKLKTYVENWINWLAGFILANDGLTPTEFPPESLPYADPGDFTGHMCALWLAGCVSAVMGGSKNPNADIVIQACMTQINENYINTGIPQQVMNGSWSPAVRLETGNGPESNGMFFGFWSGETLRALGLYVIYMTRDHDKPIY